MSLICLRLFCCIHVFVCFFVGLGVLWGSFPHHLWFFVCIWWLFELSKKTPNIFSILRPFMLFVWFRKKMLSKNLLLLLRFCCSCLLLIINIKFKSLLFSYWAEIEVNFLYSRQSIVSSSLFAVVCLFVCLLFFVCFIVRFT